MPVVSAAQGRAMHAAQDGRSTLGIPVSVANEFLGSTPPKKRKTHRGGSPRGKPGSSHLAALQTAHGKGDFAGAKTHALNYAKAVHQATMPAAAAVSGPMNLDPDAATEQTETPPPSAPAAKSNSRAALAKLAMSMRK